MLTGFCAALYRKGVAAGSNGPRRCPVREENHASASVPSVGEVSSRKKPVVSGRRKFLEQVGVAATLAAGALEMAVCLRRWELRILA